MKRLRRTTHSGPGGQKRHRHKSSHNNKSIVVDRIFLLWWVSGIQLLWQPYNIIERGCIIESSEVILVVSKDYVTYHSLSSNWVTQYSVADNHTKGHAVTGNSVTEAYVPENPLAENYVRYCSISEDSATEESVYTVTECASVHLATDDYVTDKSIPINSSTTYM